MRGGLPPRKLDRLDCRRMTIWRAPIARLCAGTIRCAGASAKTVSKAGG